MPGYHNGGYARVPQWGVPVYHPLWCMPVYHPLWCMPVYHPFGDPFGQNSTVLGTLWPEFHCFGQISLIMARFPDYDQISPIL